MDKKKVNTLLIIAVSCIWGIVLYKFIAPYFAKTEAIFISEVPTKPLVAKVRKKDTVALSFPERDPFLGKPVTKTQKAKKAKKKPRTVSKPVLWPKIEYLGFVKSNSSKGRLGLVRIDGKLYRVNTNMEVNGLRIKKIANDVMVLLNGKEERHFKKN
jgi:hypothetical protein